MRKILLITLLLVMALTSRAQDVTITITAPETAVAGQGFRLIYSINSTEGRFQQPDFDPSFNVSGPQTSSSRNVQWINGDLTSVSSTTILYYITPTKEGHFSIPAASYTSKKSTVSSDAVEIEVVASGSQTAVQQQTSGSAGNSKASGNEVYMKLILSDDEVYAGQPVTATLKLYTRINLSGLDGLKLPEMRGFLREDIDTPPLTNLEMENINGVDYGTGVLQKFILFPQIAGEIKIDPAQITVYVQQRTRSNDPFFDDPFFSSVMSRVSNVPRQIASEVRTIKVKALPSPQPSDFHGAVGSFELSASLDKTELEVNDALSYKITLKGSGNLPLAGTPDIKFPQGIEKYDPETDVKKSSPGAGTKTFKYLLIPRNTGSFEIPPVSYTVFDIKQNKYVTLRAGGYTVRVTGNAQQPENQAAESLPRGEETKYLGQDVRFIRNEYGKILKSKGSLIVFSEYWLMYALAIAVAVAVLLFRREYIRRNADIKGVRHRKASRVAKKRLAKAYAHLTAKKFEMVNEELAGALWGYLGDKLSIPLSDLTRDNCYSALRKNEIDEEYITDLDNILSACEYSRFSPTSRDESPAELYKRTVELIGKLENAL